MRSHSSTISTAGRTALTALALLAAAALAAAPPADARLRTLKSVANLGETSRGTCLQAPGLIHRYDPGHQTPWWRNGAMAKVFDCNAGRMTQRWETTEFSGGWVQIRTVGPPDGPDKCLAVDRRRRAPNGYRVALQRCGGKGSQFWKFEFACGLKIPGVKTRECRRQIRPKRFPRMCLAPKRGAVANAGLTTLYRCNPTNPRLLWDVVDPALAERDWPCGETKYGVTCEITYTFDGIDYNTLRFGLSKNYGPTGSRNTVDTNVGWLDGTNDPNAEAWVGPLKPPQPRKRFKLWRACQHDWVYRYVCTPWVWRGP